VCSGAPTPGRRHALQGHRGRAAAHILEAHAHNLDLEHLPEGVLASDTDFAIFNKGSVFKYDLGR